MKRIIDGKRYNTETAEEIASWENNFYSHDFQHCAETLYRTKKGQFFMVGEGGPMSKYSVPVGSNGRGGGCVLEVLSDSEAKTWLEEHDKADELEEHFETEIEDA